MSYNKNALLRLARDSIRSKLSNQEPLLTEELKKLTAQHGVFVTLHKKGQLRGCIGFPHPILPLNQAIVQAAQSAAFSDPRFPAVTALELADIKIEISVLTQPEEIKCPPEDRPEHIKIGEDGLIIKDSGHSGLLLPQVFVEYNSTPIKALNMVCEKAGLPQDAWKSASTQLYKFQADVFSE